MSVTTPKTIVISTLGGRIQSKTPVSYAPHIDPVITEDYIENGVKKRRRLTHLTPDERMMRRKLKNRVAAQNARDRKKERMGVLEDEVQQLIDENKKLQEENEKLRLQSKTLSVENTTLRSRLSGDSDVVDLGPVLEHAASRESAALAFPPQQDWPRAPVQSSMTTASHLTLIAMLLTYSLSSSACSNKSARWQKSSRSKTRTAQKLSLTPRQCHLLREYLRMRRGNPHNMATTAWWGSHQRSWNPASN